VPSLVAERPWMRFLADDLLYHRTEECLQWLLQISAENPATASGGCERCHLYWYGNVSLKQAFTVKSFLATQDLDSTELWLWLDGERGYAGYEKNPLLRPLLPYVQVRRFDAKIEIADTPVERSPQLYEGVNPTLRSNLFRHVFLFKYGGIYADMDTMFLQDIRGLPTGAEEFCYRWSAHKPYGNSAFLRLRQYSETARALLVRCAEKGSCRPHEVLRFDDSIDLDLLVLPCVCFDPLWPHHDRRDRYHAAPFDRFGDFFRRFEPELLHNGSIRSYQDFFPGAFAYHWHNFWDASEDPNSYFGLFNQEFDTILKNRLAIEPAV
jgi:hypothetical protein